MIIDSSALIAILMQEPDAQIFADAVEAAPVRKIAAPTYFEVCMVYAARKGPTALTEIDEILSAANARIEPFGENAARLAFQAFTKFGKGNHPARLNFGDCMSYALAKIEAMPLLFKGDDFRLTDVECAI